MPKGRELGGALTPKQREVPVCLALHPRGVRREVLNEAVWPGSRPPRPYNSFHNTLSALRRALAESSEGVISNLILKDGGRRPRRRRLLATSGRAAGAPRPAGTEVQALLGDAIDLYRGDLAEDLLVSWAEPVRDSTRRDVLDALGVVIRAETDPETLALLERTTLDEIDQQPTADTVELADFLQRRGSIPKSVSDRIAAAS